VTAAQRRLKREASLPLRTCSWQRGRWAWSRWLLCSLTLAMALGGEGRGRSSPSLSFASPASGTQEPLTPIPPPVVEDPLQTQLGERLFHDPRLSHDNRQSCATCHPLDHGGMDGWPRAMALDGQLRLRNTPTIFNVGLNFWFNWDGGTHSLEAHAEQLLRNPAVMNTTWPELHNKLAREAHYISAFRAAYADGLTWNNVISALSSFERSLTTPQSRFDAYLRGEREALTAEEQQGYSLFKTYGCVACHQGVNIGGNMFAKFGVFQSPNESSEEASDRGRANVTQRPQDVQVFRVPSLRNVAVTAPYFHDGRAPTLAIAVDTMARVQLGKTLTPEETNRIVQFLHTLTGDYRGASLQAPTPGAG
jgi:cytochrome c peroxidase